MTMPAGGKTYCRVLMRCVLCGREEYRLPRFVPAVVPLFRGHEDRLAEWCCGVPASEYYDGICRGQMETVPGFNHDLTLHNFEVDMETITDGKVMGKQRVSSLHEVREIEKLSLKKHANGEGQPMVFRDLSQDHRNRGVNTLTGTPYEKHRSAPREQVFNTHAGAITAKRVDPEKVGA